MPDSRRASGGAGSVHHIAFRARDDAEQLGWREKIASLGYNVSPVMDRTYFHSIYFRELHDGRDDFKCLRNRQ
jgi:glyoxalase family protein